MGWTRILPHSHRCLPPSSPAWIPHTPAQIPLPPPPLHLTSHKSCSISKPVAGGISSLGRHRQTIPTIPSTGLHGDLAVASSSAQSAPFRRREAPPPPDHLPLHPHRVSPLLKRLCIAADLRFPLSRQNLLFSIVLQRLVKLLCGGL